MRRVARAPYFTMIPERCLGLLLNIHRSKIIIIQLKMKIEEFRDETRN